MTDSASPDTSLERSLFSIAGIGFRSRQCAAEEGVVAEGAGCLACIAPTAPVTRAVFDALPELKMVTSLGEAMDHIDLEAAKEHGVWITNVPAKSTVTLEDQRRAAVINILSWLTHGKPTNVVVVGR